MSEPTTLYRCFDTSGVLLYVGIARSWPSRMQQHAREKHWWGDVGNVATQQFPTRHDAEEAEKKAIRTERPVHNVTHATRPAAAAPSMWLRWICMTCKEEIPVADGFLQVAKDDPQRHAQEMADWDADYEGVRLITGTELMAYPRPVRWEVVCRECDLGLDDAPYWIELDRVRTWPHVAQWTAHLMGKTWFADTNWDQLLYRLIETNTPAGWKAA